MNTQARSEDGFTLIEILVVILIIGILAAIAIPVFMNQRKEAENASVKADLKNAATAMGTELVKNNNKYPSYLPNYNPRTDGAVVTLVKDKSNEQDYCLKGYFQDRPTRVTYFDSSQGGLLKEGVACDAAIGKTYAEDTNGKTALVLQLSGRHNEAMKALNAYGFKEVTYNSSATLKDFANYDVIVAMGDAWSVSSYNETLLKQAFDAGHKILTDGNDTGRDQRPWMFTSSKFYGVPEASPLYYNKTGNTGLNPSFPYTFKATAFSGDSSWVCTPGVQPGIVSIAESVLSNNPNQKCVTAAGATSPAGGRWVHMSRAPLDANQDTNMLGAGLNWLTLK